MLVCLPDVMSHKRKATLTLPEGIAISKRRHLNHETTICVEHKASLTLPLPQQKKMNGAHLNSPIRRQASLKAQIALQLILNESPPTSPVSVENDAYFAGSDPSFTTEIVQDRIPEPAVIHVTPEPTPEPDENTAAATPLLNMARYATPDDAALDYGVVIDSPPASTTSSDSDTKEVDERQLSSLTSLRMTKLKKPVINVVDCKKVVLCSRKKPTTPMNTCKRSVQVDSSGFLKRMASLNARACVTALIEPEKKYARQKPHRVLQQKATHDPPVAIGLKSESLLQESAPHHLHDSEVHLRRSTGGATVAIKSPPPEAYHSDASMSVIPRTVTAVPDGIQEDDNAVVVPFNSLGLLYNGSTVHPDARVFLTSKGMLPTRIIPSVVPPQVSSLHLMEYVQNAREQHKGKARKPRAQKGDNGWTCLGNPIKTIIRIERDVRVTRKYYAGIRRKDKEVFVRDCIVVKSGKRKQDKPFLAKIASIWQETGNIMMTIFWYYTPDDVKGINMADFQENEVLASQHHDDNAVACIEDKCYILGFRQYCRYQALVRRKGANPAPVVPDLNRKEENSEKQYPPLENVDPSLVFLCYQGYNHISGKLCKGSNLK